VIERKIKENMMFKKKPDNETRQRITRIVEQPLGGPEVPDWSDAEREKRIQDGMAFANNNHGRQPKNQAELDAWVRNNPNPRW
jgi:hypothetical protein